MLFYCFDGETKTRKRFERQTTGQYPLIKVTKKHGAQEKPEINKTKSRLMNGVDANALTNEADNICAAHVSRYTEHTR